MTPGQWGSTQAGHRRSTRILVASAALLLLGPAIVSNAGTGGDASDDAQIIAEAKQVEHEVIVSYNEKKWDELRALYTQDAVALPPNHEPVRGPDAIIEYLRGVRDVAGAIDIGSLDYVRVTRSGRLVDLVTNFTIQSGRVRMVYQGLYERQADGSTLLGVDHFAFRDPAGSS